mgnify:CR=1 FL=1
MMSTSEQKALLRKSLISKRKTLSLIEWKKKSDEIKEHILNSSEFKSSKVVHCFVSMNEKLEVETHSLIEEMISNGRRVIIPVMNIKEGTLCHSELFNLNELKTNEWGVLEPVRIKPISIHAIDLILVPLLGVDLNGNRLGYGKGYYDQFLGEVKAKTLGLVMEQFILKKIPIENFDIKLDGIVSEKGVKYT